MLYSFRKCASELKIKQNDFIKFLLDFEYIYRDDSGSLKPHEKYIEWQLFTCVNYNNSRNGYKGIQTLITETGKETFRIMLESMKREVS